MEGRQTNNNYPLGSPTLKCLLPGPHLHQLVLPDGMVGAAPCTKGPPVSFPCPGRSRSHCTDIGHSHSHTGPVSPTVVTMAKGKLGKGHCNPPRRCM